MNIIKMKCLSVLWMLSSCIINAQAATHWMVTETGLIQPRIDSPFEMARPYDLLAFLNQDTRWDGIVNLYHDLHKHHKNIEKLWADMEKATDISTVLMLDENCESVGELTSIDWYTSFLEDGKSKGIPDEEYLLHDNNYGDTDVPDCKKLSSLTFSMLAFEHLQGMIQRENLTASPELSLPEQIAPIMTVDPFGHWLATILRKNSSSWLHYNMASLYWRVRGNAPKAMECSRRAVHYAPREYKDIALLSMGSILHRSKIPDDALIILGAAMDHDPQYPYNHFALANVYAIVGEFNNSLKHFNECLKLNPTFELAVKHKSAVLCHMFLNSKMKEIEDTCDTLQKELTEFNDKEVEWLKSQASFLRTMKHAEEFDYRDVEKNCIRMTELTGLNINELKHQGDRSSLIKYFLDSPMYDANWFQVKGVSEIEAAYSVQRLVNHINKQAHMVSSFIIPSDQFKVQDGKIVRDPQVQMALDSQADTKGKLAPDSAEMKPESHKKSISSEDDISQYDTGIIMYPPTMKINRYQKDFDVETDWPSTKQCKEFTSDLPENIKAIYPVFLPFENKGIRLGTLLSDKIGVPATMEHELPWHPPRVRRIKKPPHSHRRKARISYYRPQIATDVVMTKHLREKLLEYVGDGDPELVRNMQDAEIGQRIYAAMQMKLAPKWVLYTLASLYWRVRGNRVQALHCLANARGAEPRHRDVVLASRASLYLEMGYFDEALAAAEDAFRLSLYEPVTNFILAELNMLKKHRYTHLFHLKQVVRVEPRFMDGLARALLVRWACLIKQVDALQELELTEGDFCTQMEPGISMVCEKDGSNCHVANIHCFSNHERETSGIVRMLELKDDNLQSVPMDTRYMDTIDGSIFDPIINNMPTERTDKVGHQKNYESMLKIIDKAVKSCGAKGCYHMYPEGLPVKEEECSNQKLQLSYWLHIISFRQLFTDTDISFPNEIAGISSSGRKVPECRMSTDALDDFFVERVWRVDGEGWEPILSLMHQFAEMFNFYDYIALGAKIAKYIDTKGGVGAGAAWGAWWCGAAGRGACARRCAAAALHAHARAPAHAHHALAAVAALLHMQSKPHDAKEIAYLSFYASPKSKVEAFLVAVSHTYLGEYEKAVWMYRYALSFDDKFLPAKACLHATMCLMLY